MNDSPLRILLITQSLPWPMRRNGGSQRTELLRRALAAWGDVDVVGVGGDEMADPAAIEANAERLRFIRHFDTTPATRPNVRAPWPLKSTLIQRASYLRRYDRHAELVDWLGEQQRAVPYDLIVARYLRAAAKAGLLARVGVPTILDFDDIDDRLFRSHVEMNPWPGVGGRIGAAIVERSVRRITRAAPDRFAATWACSEEDAILLGGEARRVSVVPNVPFREADEPPIAALLDDPSSKMLLFVGDLTYDSNRNGVARFVREAWPLVRAAVPTATFELVGKIDDAHPSTRSWRTTPGVDVRGYVDDLPAAYRRAAATVAPIWIGGGTKIKVVESLSLGRACVTTHHCLRGYGPLVRAGVLSGTDDAASMAASCIKLLSDPARRADVGARAAAIARDAFSFGAVQAAIDATVGLVLGRSRTHDLKTD